jgi:queuine/archaeosine tRNA-ribosyltransferase
MTLKKDEAIEIIESFERKNPDELVSRKELIDLITATNVYMLHEISEQIREEILNSSVDYYTQHEKDLSKKIKF